MAKFHCTYCQNPIFTCRIKCAECPDFDLCLQCFACGAESGPHKKEHDYHVFDDGYLTIFEGRTPVVEEKPAENGDEGAEVTADEADRQGEEWTTSEEETLLEALEHFGFGNWDDIAGHVKSKTVKECEDHYYSYFIHGNIGKATFPTEYKNNKVIDHTCPDGGPLSPSLTTSVAPPELSLAEQQELGYMPLRDDFERDYDNEAESLVSDLSINYDDEDIDIALKLAKVDMYRQRLKERDRRKKIARDYNLMSTVTTIGAKKTQTTKKKQTKEEKELEDKMRVFAQFHSPADHERFFENLKKEKQVKNRIKELIRYRRNGITKLDEVGDYEAEKQRRDKRKEHKKKLASLATAKRTSMVSKKAEEKDGENIEDIIGDRGLGNKGRETNGHTGNDLLSDRERRLCHSIGLKPNSYITIKTCIIKDYLQRRQGIPVKVRYPSHLDKTHRRKILNFLSENGWISSVSSG